MVANGSAPKRNRFSFALPKSRIEGILAFFRRGEIWSRSFICLIGMVGIWLGTGGWNPPFPFRERFVPERELVARTEFEFENRALTREEENKAVSEMRCVYSNDVSVVTRIQNDLINQLFEVIGAEQYPEQDWKAFYPDGVGEEIRSDFDRVKAELVKNDEKLEKVKQAVEATLGPIAVNGLIQKLEHEVFQGSILEIMVYEKGDFESLHLVSVSDVRIVELESQFYENLEQNLQKANAFEDVSLLQQRIGFWIFSHFESSLKLDTKETKARREKVIAGVPPVTKKYEVGEPLVYEGTQFGTGQGIIAGEPLNDADIAILRAEHDAYVIRLTASQKSIYSFADFGLYTAVFLLCGAYMYYRERHTLKDIGRFSMIVATFVVAVVLAYNLEDRWRVELVPLTVFSMVISIAYRHEIAWILGSSAAVVVTYSLGLGLTDLIVFISAVTTGSLLCHEISGRTKLFYVGILMGLITFATSLGSGILTGQVPNWQALISNQLLLAAWFGFCAFLSALLITVILPFVEQLFDVQTDLTLLEWSDPSHELLNKMIQRAPGTYNHSINVASIAETAADAIGANGLLCRVGAYFHDVGKMLKPEYFVENQASGENKHDSLVPAMSSLVIIAHVKDGVELARKHKLPTSMIDMIEQHHGTTLVEYFYDQAVKEAEAKGEEEEVDESNFRYPGPKPQTKEACVMMLADAVESACRTLTEPAPARIEGLVKEISAKKLNDGQFTECPLTLKELHRIEESLTKSLISVYHSRIKYPEHNGNE